MVMEEEPWEYYHHHSHLLDHIEYYSNELSHPLVVDFLSFFFIDIVDSARNLSNIEETISINILSKPNIAENIHVGKYCSPSELYIYHYLFYEFQNMFSWSYEEIQELTLV